MNKNKLTVILFIGLLFLGQRTLGQSFNWDYQILKSVNNQRNAHNYFYYHSESARFAPFVIPIGILSAGLILKDKPTILAGIYISSSIIASSIITTLIKQTTDRTRPFHIYSDITKLDSGGSPSFPSGHTSAAFSVATAVSLQYRKWYIVVPSMAWAVGVGYSRLNLGVHYPSDVYFGALLGVGSALATYKFNQWIVGKYNKKWN